MFRLTLPLICWLFVSTWTLRAQERVDLPSDSSDRDPKTEAIYEYFKMESIALAPVIKTSGESLVVGDAPLFKFASEGNTYGSVYLWSTKEGRPGLIGTIGSLPINGFNYGFLELHSLLTDPLETIKTPGRDSKNWTPSGNGQTPTEIDTNMVVAANESGRMIQLRNIAKKFEAEMIENEQVNPLRLLPQPIYRIANSEINRDGAIFAFVWTVGTDPEVLLRIESFDGDDGKPHWRVFD
jgi:hypothetical protein